jgi:NitT/TauT family transport system ATP-binding protein
MPETLCELRKVCHDFAQPNGQMRRVLDDINLTIQSEEVVALLGPSGCGKSTILRIFAGLIAPTQGEALHKGKPLTGLNPGVAIVFQSFALYPWMTVAQNVQLVLEAARLSPSEINQRSEKAIRMVGLSGFEEAYPRELSGGMKQRVGMARALSVDPEMLFLDEPFSQVDALTAESLRAEVLDLWSAKGLHLSSILMVSHDIKEVAFMADRIVILGANPGRIRTIVDNRLPRPRDYRSADFNRLVDQLHDLITGQEMPDAPVGAAPAAAAAFEPLPEATVSEIIGVLEYLDAREGKEDLFRIAQDSRQRFDRVLGIVKAAELLNFVDTPKRLVVLEADGKRFLQADIEHRKAIWREQLLKLYVFRCVQDALQRQPDHALERDFLLETFVLHMPEENAEKMCETFIRWARFGNLFAYDERSGMITLQ